MPSEIIIIVIELMFLGVNMFLALLRQHFKMSSRAKNIFTPANINSMNANVTRSILERREDLYMKGLKNTIETYGLLEHNPSPF